VVLDQAVRQATSSVAGLLQVEIPMTKRSFMSLMVGVVMAFGGLSNSARAEVSEIGIALSYGIGHLPSMMMEDMKLIEKHAKAAGLGDVKVKWVRFAGASDMNSALLSGSLDFAAQGIPGLISLWARTAGTPQEVKGVAALSSLPMYLNTRNPNVKSLKDFTDRDRIAVPSIKVSVQAVTLQMAAEQVFGPGEFAKLDRLTVSLGHPDAQIALLSGRSEITAHLSSPPFQYQQLKQPGIRKVLESYDVLGGPASFNVVVTTKRFREANPKAYGAYLAALREAIETITRDRRAAAESYLRMSKDKSSIDEILAMLNDPQIMLTMTPQSTWKYATFMHKVGTIKTAPGSWKDLFFPEIHHLPGG